MTDVLDFIGKECKTIAEDSRAMVARIRSLFPTIANAGVNLFMDKGNGSTSYAGQGMIVDMSIKTLPSDGVVLAITGPARHGVTSRGHSTSGESVKLGKSAALCAATLALAGCANLASVGRRTELPVPAAASEGKAIHLDASQRLFYQTGAHFCAEPMPDALQSLASSAGVGAAVSDRVSATVSNAFSTNAASIGLHTQSTTLMRDQYYRICELAANSNMSPPQVAQLMERAQRYTLGILAIEQLTGAVAAQQAGISTDTASSAAASLGATQDAFDKAADALSDRKAAATAAATAASAAEATAKQSANDLANANPQTQALKDKAAADQTAATKADADFAAAAQNQKEAQATVDTLRGNLGSARAKSDAAAKGNASFSSTVGHPNIDKDTAAAIATATQDIVTKMLQRGDIVDSCMAMMMGKDDRAALEANAGLLETCKSAIAQAVAIAKEDDTVPFKAAGTVPFKLMMDVDSFNKLTKGQAVDAKNPQQRK